jgi:TldD protein
LEYDHLLDLIERALRLAEEKGAEFADARIQFYRYEALRYDTDTLKEHSYTSTSGVGFRVVYKGFHGYSSTTKLDEESIKQAVLEAFENARALSLRGGTPMPLAEYKTLRVDYTSPFQIDPFAVPDEEKIEIVKKAVDTAMSVEGVVSAVAAVGLQDDDRTVVNTEGSRVRVRIVSTGLYAIAYAKGKEGLERVTDRSGRVAGWEHIRGLNVEELASNTARLAVKVADAGAPKAGKYRVVLDPEVVGLLVHEALGHASEADHVVIGASVIAGKLGQKIASDLVSIVDDGRHPDGYIVPYDDEGVEKTVSTIIEDGVLRGLLVGRAEAAKLGLPPTGNSRVMSYKHPILVRQTNYYMLPRDYSLEEILEEAKNGIYVTARGARGGQVDPGMGTFTFNVGVSHVIRNGELAEPLRGVSIAGQILETLKKVVAVGKDLKVVTGAVFGGCGKGGQLVRVGDGGPHVLVEEMSVGGR